MKKKNILLRNILAFDFSDVCLGQAPREDPTMLLLRIPKEISDSNEQEFPIKSFIVKCLGKIWFVTCNSLLQSFFLV